MPRKTASNPVSFEELYTELENTIDKLEAGNLTLDEAMALYERGMELAKQCNVLLDSAELRIQELAPTPSALSEPEEDLELLDGEEDA